MISLQGIYHKANTKTNFISPTLLKKKNYFKTCASLSLIYLTKRRSKKENNDLNLPSINKLHLFEYKFIIYL